MAGQTNMGSIMKELIANPETADIKNNPDFVQKTIKDVLSDPTEIRKTKLATKEFDEKSLISKELISLAKSDFGVDLQVYSENDSGIYDPKDIVEEIRAEFSYFYPVDSRHSGRDLVPNHLTFFVLNHVAIFPENNWPQQIVVNGSVLMDGKKMSKSMGNIIPLREAVRKYGADPIRLTILISAELLQDADFNVEAIKGIKNKLASMYEDCTKTKAEKFPELEPEDKWMHGILQNLVLNVGKSMDEIRLREALHHILFDIFLPSINTEPFTTIC